MIDFVTFKHFGAYLNRINESLDLLTEIIFNHRAELLEKIKAEKYYMKDEGYWEKKFSKQDTKTILGSPRLDLKMKKSNDYQITPADGLQPPLTSAYVLKK